MRHDLKCWPPFFDHILQRRKTFEARKNDRGFAVGHVLRLQEFDPRRKEYTGRSLDCRVIYMLDDCSFGIAEGHCILGLSDVVAVSV